MFPFRQRRFNPCSSLFLTVLWRTLALSFMSALRLSHSPSKPSHSAAILIQATALRILPSKVLKPTKLLPPNTLQISNISIHQQTDSSRHLQTSKLLHTSNSQILPHTTNQHPSFKMSESITLVSNDGAQVVVGKKPPPSTITHIPEHFN